jgi:hypothetical protein
VWLRGNTASYASWFLDKYGIEQFQRLSTMSKMLKRWRTHEIIDLIEALKRGPADYELLYEEKHGWAATDGSGSLKTNGTFDSSATDVGNDCIPMTPTTQSSIGDAPTTTDDCRSEWNPQILSSDE